MCNVYCCHTCIAHLKTSNKFITPSLDHTIDDYLNIGSPSPLTSVIPASAPIGAQVNSEVVPLLLILALPDHFML
jgi:hypothetical protein